MFSLAYAKSNIPTAINYANLCNIMPILILDLEL
jgi:hypothetical protein